MKNIKLANGAVISSEEFLEDINAIDHIQDVLLPAIELGDWAYLESLAVVNDTEHPILFSDNTWDLSRLGQGYQSNRLLFNHSTKKSFDGYILPRNIRNEIKCFAAVELFTDYGRYTYLSIVDTVSKLTLIAKHATDIGINSFSEIDEDVIYQLKDNGLVIDDKGNKTLSAINRLVQCQDLLPFHMEINRKLHPKLFNLAVKIPDQHFAIPFRIYFEMLKSAIDSVSEAYKYRLELERAVDMYLAHSSQLIEELTRKVRFGEIALSSVIAYRGNEVADRVIRMFNSSGVQLVDYGSEPKWQALWDECAVTGFIGVKAWNIWGTLDLQVGEQAFLCRDEFAEYIRNLQANAAFLIMALSGMRISELYEISPNYGAQDHIKIGSNPIYALTTKQEKLTLDSQTSDDVYITNHSGFKAFHVLNAIHKPYRARFSQGKNQKFFGALSEVYKPRAIGKVGLGRTIRETIKRLHNELFIMNINDLDSIRSSNPDNSKKLDVGDSFPYTNHQCRRSFAYYLIGLELMDFPQLKQQLGHISIAMTRWYARNAHSLKAIYSEVREERINRSAIVFADSYLKLANRERLAGGLGKSLSKELVENENYFKEGLNNRKLSVDYWKNEIKTGKVHIHAIGKGMYCTKRQCAMRASIDLSECTDCAWDLIDDASSAESIRMTAMRNLMILRDSNELNGSSASKLVMDIRSAEKIMTDLNFPFESFHVPLDVANMIPVRNI
ncbi:TPA: site-specific integrase [Vibrio vulnificus]|nr:site-specific integrase [Vibrio vulnificus]